MSKTPRTKVQSVFLSMLVNRLLALDLSTKACAFAISDMSKIHLVFEKSITRDWSAIYAQIWHEVFTKEFKKQFGWGLTDIVYKVDKNYVNVYRAPFEYIEGMRNFILIELKKDSKWILKQAQKVQKQTESIINWINHIKRKPYSLYPNKELANILNQLIRKNVQIGPKYIVMLWFPIQMEIAEESKIYKKATLIAKKTRKKIHILGAIVDKFIRELVEESLKRAKFPSNLSKFVTCQEVLDYLCYGTLITKKYLLKKKNGFIITKDGVLFESVNNYLTRKGYSLQDKVHFSSKFLIKGTTAYNGFVKGKAKVIINKKMFGKFKNKDILVTAMTTPDFLPLMLRSSAFVTDEGGITCHAAILSRELKIPCVIGTKIATKFLKDGDLVEVDANKGIVKKLKWQKTKNS